MARSAPALSVPPSTMRSAQCSVSKMHWQWVVSLPWGGRRHGVFSSTLAISGLLFRYGSTRS